MAVAMLIAVVVLPTPPFWLAIATRITTFLPFLPAKVPTITPASHRSAIVPRGTCASSRSAHAVPAAPNALSATARPCRLWKIGRIIEQLVERRESACRNGALARRLGHQSPAATPNTSAPRPSVAFARSSHSIRRCARFDHQHLAVRAERAITSPGKPAPVPRSSQGRCFTWNMAQELRAESAMCRRHTSPDLRRTPGSGGHSLREASRQISRSSRSAPASSHSGRLWRSQARACASSDHRIMPPDRRRAWTSKRRQRRRSDPGPVPQPPASPGGPPSGARPSRAKARRSRHRESHRPAAALRWRAIAQFASCRAR
jgi:hypothetical protein